MNAQSGEVLHGTFTDSGATGGSVNVTMPDGEVLAGRYSAIRETDAFTFTVGSDTAMDILAVYGVLDGHGFGEARTNDGRTYRVQF